MPDVDVPFLDFERREAEQERWLQSRPTCCQCGEHIQEERAVRINGDWYCDECIEDMREWVGDD